MSASIYSANLKPGTFRGVAFQCPVQASDEGGRRLAIHRYPQRDDAYAEDLGRRSEAFEVEAIIVGTDWLQQADRLMDACNQAGPGELIHPWFGMRRVVCSSAKRSFDTKQLGTVRFTLQFFDAAANRYPAATLDTGAALRDSADRTIEPARIDWERRASTTGQGSFVRERLRATLDGLRKSASSVFAPSGNRLGIGTDTLDVGRDILGGTDDTLGFAQGALSGVRGGGRSGLSSLSGLLLGDYADLVDRPATLAYRTQSIARMLSYSYDSPSAGAYAVQSWNTTADPYRATWSTPPATVAEAQAVAATTPSRAQVARNERALGELMDRAALAAEARRVPERAFDSREAALAYRDDLSARLAAAALRAADLGDDASHAALLTLRAAVSTDLTQRAGALSRVTEYTPGATLPALRLAWLMYGDDPSTVVDQTTALARRNRVSHPGFVTGGRKLEVLLDASA